MVGDLQLPRPCAPQKNALKPVCSEKVTRNFSMSSWLMGIKLIDGTRQRLDLNMGLEVRHSEVVFLRDDVEDMLALVRNDSNG